MSRINFLLLFFGVSMGCCYVSLFADEPLTSKSFDETPWIRPEKQDDLPRWGIKGHLQWGISDGGKRDRSPRGLIRLYSPVHSDGRYELVNFIAVEPVVGETKGFSELEHSGKDDRPGKRFDVLDPMTLQPLDSVIHAGTVGMSESGRECMTVHVGVEKFLNGAHVRLKVVQYRDTPDELELTVYRENDSAEMEYCILTATMGNKTRARLLHLDGETVSSLDLYPDYKDNHFAPHAFFPLEKLPQNSEGDIQVIITCDETDHSSAGPFPRPHWQYLGKLITQYWKKRRGTWNDDLHVAVNGRYTYWMSDMPIPRGISYENFEMREKFHDGQMFLFGILIEKDQ